MRHKVSTFDPRPDPRASQKLQPALFDQTQVKPSNENRYQRGYTPARMRNVNKALATGGMGARVIGPGDLRAHFKQAVARSSMPLSPFKQLRSVEVHPGMSEYGPAVAGDTNTNAYGVSVGPRRLIVPVVDKGSSVVRLFHGGKPKAFLNEQGKKASRSEIMGATVLHELGHVEEAYRDPLTGMKSFGERERYGDRYMVKHYRSDPREVRRGTALDPEDYTYPAVMGPADIDPDTKIPG